MKSDFILLGRLRSFIIKLNARSHKTATYQPNAAKWHRMEDPREREKEIEREGERERGIDSKCEH